MLWGEIRSHPCSDFLNKKRQVKIQTDIHLSMEFKDVLNQSLNLSRLQQSLHGRCTQEIPTIQVRAV